MSHWFEILYYQIVIVLILYLAFLLFTYVYPRWQRKKRNEARLEELARIVRSMEKADFIPNPAIVKRQKERQAAYDRKHPIKAIKRISKAWIKRHFGWLAP